MCELIDEAYPLSQNARALEREAERQRRQAMLVHAQQQNSVFDCAALAAELGIHDAYECDSPEELNARLPLEDLQALQSLAVASSSSEQAYAADDSSCDATAPSSDDESLRDVSPNPPRYVPRITKPSSPQIRNNHNHSRRHRALHRQDGHVESRSSRSIGQLQFRGEPTRPHPSPRRTCHMENGRLVVTCVF